MSNEAMETVEPLLVKYFTVWQDIWTWRPTC